MVRLVNMSFARKLSLVSFATIAPILLLVGLVFTLYTVRNFRTTLSRQLATQADMIGYAAAPALVFIDQRAAAEALSALRAEPQISAAAIYDNAGQLFARYSRAGSSIDQPDEVPATAPLPDTNTQFDHRRGVGTLARVVLEDDRQLGTVFLLADLDELDQRVTRNAITTAVILTFGLAAALVIARFLQREITAPVLDLAALTHRVAAAKDYSIRAPVRGTDELGRLVKGFNDMLQEIQQRDQLLERANVELRRRTDELARKNEEVESFVYVVSHDLRAPLVNLQGFSRELELSCRALEKELNAADLPACARRAIKDVIDDEIPSSLRFISASTSKFERLINALLQLSRTGRRDLCPETIDMGALAASTLDSLHHNIEEKGATVFVGSLPTAFGDVTAIGQVLTNLITNSLRYLDPERAGDIAIAGEQRDGMGHYWVRDNGVGIPENAQKKLFQVFQRLRPDLADGEGIGLVSVKRIIERSGGRVWAESIEHQGTTLHFTLPLPSRQGGP